MIRAAREAAAGDADVAATAGGARCAEGGTDRPAAGGAAPPPLWIRFANLNQCACVFSLLYLYPGCCGGPPAAPAPPALEYFRVN